ncbi:hypothetical protein [Dyella sp. A6]|uniref:hypothetical protein n=1 Tax=Dyella aluminiiresistens TaxID=3069105 RepID=UPI002E7A26D6|nr:hypothetical protein [Dyella sp. A6]
MRTALPPLNSSLRPLNVVMLLLDRENDLSVIAEAQDLDLRNVRERDWPAVLGAKNAVRLTLYNVMAPQLPDLSGLASLNALSITWANKIQTITPIFNMPQLRHLLISDFAKLRDLSGLEQLSSLEELHLSGNLGSLSPPLRLLSLAPVYRLESLQSFSLRNAKLEDDDITGLSDCSQLRQLDLSNQFERQQFAYLAKHLNAQLEQPICAHRPTSLTCEKCGIGKRLVTGRRGPLLCPACDRARLAKAEIEFAKLMEKV